MNVAEGPGLGSCGVFDKQPYEGKYLNESINTWINVLFKDLVDYKLGLFNGKYLGRL